MLTAPFLLAKALLPGHVRAALGPRDQHRVCPRPRRLAVQGRVHLREARAVGLTKTIALEAAARCPDVTAHAICPSYVRTPLVEAQIADQARVHGIPPAEVVQNVLLAENAVKRLIEPDDVAEAVVFLCGPAAWTMTGSVLPMDAGRLAH